MKDRNSSADKTLEALRQAGLRQPNVEESIACKGTALESATLKVRGKAFLFLRPGKAMLKLGSSQKAALKLADEQPAYYNVGAGGWTTVDLSDPKKLSMRLLESWIAESHGLFASKRASRIAKSK